MTNRLTVALAALLLSTGAACAQPAVPGPPPAALPVDAAAVQLPTAAPVAGSNAGPAFWADGDVVFSWFRGVSLPPLVTTSAVGTPAPMAGVLGQPATRTLFGSTAADDGLRVGFRLAAGYWFGSERRFGVEAGFLMTGSQSTTFATSASQSPILARPYTDATNFTQQAALLAYPGLSTDSINVNDASGHLYSGNLDVDVKLVDDGWFRLIGLAGWRYYRYDEGLDIRQTIVPTSPIFVPGTQINVTDRFSTHNLFQGLDLGFRPQFSWQALTLDLLARASVGNLHHTVNIAGEQVVAVPGFAVVTQPAGLYALSTNVGRHTSNDWVVTPEFGAGIGWRVTSNLKVRLGYGLIYLNGVARAADQVNTIINPLRLPGTPVAGAVGPAQPTFYLNRTDIWIQNVNVGLEFSY